MWSVIYGQRHPSGRKTTPPSQQRKSSGGQFTVQGCTGNVARPSGPSSHQRRPRRASADDWHCKGDMLLPRLLGQRRWPSAVLDWPRRRVAARCRLGTSRHTAAKRQRPMPPRHGRRGSVNGLVDLLLAVRSAPLRHHGQRNAAGVASRPTRWLAGRAVSSPRDPYRGLGQDGTRATDLGRLWIIRYEGSERWVGLLRAGRGSH
jgi:hypothetical protein